MDKTLHGSLFSLHGNCGTAQVLNRKMCIRRSKFFNLYSSTSKHLNRANVWTVNVVNAWTKLSDFESDSCEQYGVQLLQNLHGSV